MSQVADPGAVRDNPDGQFELGLDLLIGATAELASKD